MRKQKINPADVVIIGKIVTRVVEIVDKKTDIEFDATMASLSLLFCHCCVCRLDLKKLMAASNMDLVHDVCGIDRYLDYETKTLQDCFLPRCNRKKSKTRKI